MQTGITTEPTRPSAREEVTALIFTLDQYDYLDLWMYEWDQGRRWPETPFHDRILEWALLALVAVIGVASVALHPWRPSHLAGEIGGFALAVALVLLAFVLWRVVARYFWPRTRRGARARYKARMRKEAAVLEQAGTTINPDRIHWFLMAPTWFAEVSKLRRRQEGLVDYESQQTLADWSAVEEIVVLERHVLLVGHTAGTWIIPTRCFRDDEDRDRFVAAARAYHQAAGRAPVASITTTPDHAEGLRDGR